MSRSDDLLHAIPGDEIVLEGERLASAGNDEWLLTTGHGGFAMGCPTGVPHRQYHALLNAAWRPPTGRVQTLHSIEESVNGAPLALVRFTKRFDEVEWVYAGEGVRLTKSVRVGHRANGGATRYCVETESGVRLALRPNITLRDMHDVLGETDSSRYETEIIESGLRVSAAGHTLEMRWDRGVFTASERWTGHVSYPTALARTGEDAYGERLWSPGAIEVACDAGVTECVVMYALAPETPGDVRRDPCEQGGALGVLMSAADDFLVDRNVGGRNLKTVIAGYPWFGDWGRDTMIALPGLMLTTGRFEEARACLETFAAYESEGMIPNLFDEDDRAHYNTVDASLWFLHAVHAFVRASGEDAGEALVGACHAIIEGYTRGTRFGIGMDDADGLIYAGDPDTQLTWMDAKRGGVAFSPRYGKCVEINALWVHGLRCVAELIEGDGRAQGWRALADRASASFNERFVRKDGLGLYDCLRPDGDDWVGIPEIRPNQLFAVSLGKAGLAREHWGAVVGVCRAHLLTEKGMRTLSPEDPNYKGRFKGDMMQRDGAYHNGTVWPWLIGAYCEAVLRAGDYSEAAREEVAGALRGLVDDLSSGCLGQIAEVYDGDAPRDQEGCCGQAWSVAEVLRLVGQCVGVVSSE